MAGTIKGIIVEIGGDTSALQKALSKVNSATSSLSKELRGINSLLKLDPSNTELLAQKQTVLAENIDKTTQKLEELKKIQQEADEKMKNGGEVSQENYRNLQREIISTENKLKDLQVQASKWTSAGQSIEEFGNKITKISSKLDNLGSTLTTTLTLPVLAIGAAAVTTGNDFEAQMSRVQAIAGATKEELEQLTEQAMELGAETTFSASEVAAGMENLASAGFNTNEIINAMPGLLDLAASSGAELATASEIAASAIRGFGLEASETGHVADVFAEAAARTNAQTEDMGEAMQYVAPVAKTVGLSIEETAAAIGIMSDAGIKGSQAGTTLRSGLVRIVKPTKQVKEAMETLGVEFYDNNGKMKSLTQIIDELQKSTAGLSDETKNQALAQIFGTEALSGMLALVNRGAGELDSMTKSFKNADGAAEKMADTMLDNTSGALESLSGSLESAGIAIQKALAPEIKDLAKWIQDLVDDFNDLSDEEQQNIIKTVALVAAIGPAIKILSKLGSGVGTITKGIGTFTKAIALTGKTTTESFKEASSATQGLAKAFTFLKSPIGIIAMSIVAVTATIALFTDEINENNQAIAKTSTETKKANEEMKNYRQSLDETKNATLTEAENTTKLADELRTLVDENGKVKDGYKDRVSFILNELNNALGTEYSMTGDVIDNYKELTQSIDDLILKKQASAILENEEAKYNKAIEEKTNAYENMIKSEKELAQAREDLLDIEKKLNSEEAKRTPQLYSQYQAQLDIQKKAVEEAQKNVETSKNTYQTYLDDIATYQNDFEIVASDNNEKIKEMITSRSYTYQQSSSDIGEAINHNIQQVQNEMQYYKNAREQDLQNQDQVNAEKNQKQIEAGQKQLEILAQQLVAMTSTTEELTPQQIEAWKNLANDSYETYEKYISQLSPEMQQKINEVTTTVNNDTTVKTATGELGKEATDEFDKSADGKQSGINFVAGAREGIEDKKTRSSLLGSLVALGKQIISTFNSSLDEHSPSEESKKSGINFVKGPILGIRKEKRNLLNEVNGLGKDMVKEFNATADPKLLKLNAMQASLNSNVIDKTQMIFTTPTLNIYTQKDINIREIADEVNRIFGSKY